MNPPTKSSINGGSQNTGLVLKDTLIFSKISPHDAWTLSVAFGFQSTDESWFDEFMEDPLHIGNC